MIRKHPRYDTNTPAGQIVNEIKTIGDYVKKVQEEELPKKKLTFEEWIASGADAAEYFSINRIDTEFAGETYFMFKCIWNAAQENV